MVYPISAHAMAHQLDEDGGFVIEATTIQDPVAFATTLEDENGPLWGAPLVEAMRDFRRWVGVLAMVNDENNGVVRLDENGQEAFDASFSATEQERLAAALDFSRDVLTAAGASKVRVDGAGLDPRAGHLPDGQRPGALGRRRGRPVVGREAPLRRRRLGRAAHALGQPVADDHGAREPPRGAPARRLRTGTSTDASRSATSRISRTSSS